MIKKHLSWMNADLLHLIPLIALLLALFPSPTFAAPPTPQGDSKKEADSLHEEGVTLFNQGDYPGAIDRFESSLKLYQETGDQEGEETALNDIGVAYQSMGQDQQALDYLQQAVTISQEIGDRAGEGAMLSNIAAIYNGMGQYSQALDSYQKVLPIFHEIDDRAREGTTLGNIAAVYNSLGQYQQSLDYDQRALAIFQEIGDRSGEGSVLFQMGRSHVSLGQYPQALDSDQRALAISREIGDRSLEGASLQNIGFIYQNQSQYQQAKEYYQKALAIVQENGDRSVEATTLNNLGAVYRGLGQNQQALDLYQKALAIQRETGDQAGEANTLNNIGFVYRNLGQYRQALDILHQSLAITEKIGDRLGKGRTLTNIGSVYHLLGQYPQALDTYQQAQAIFQEFGQRGLEGRILTSIGFVYQNLGQNEKALDYFEQSLAILQETGDRAGEGTTLNNIGLVYNSLGKSEQALGSFQKALAIVQEIGDRATEGDALNNLGLIYENLGQYPQALDSYQQALAISQEIGDRPGEGTTLHNLGFTYERQGNPAQAISYYQQAVEVIESIQGEIKVEELKSSYAGEQADTYERLVGLLWDNDRFQEAFNYAERARARAFLDELGAGSLDFRAGAGATLLERDKALKAEIAALHTQLTTLREGSQNERDNDAIAATQAELTAREGDYAQLLTDIKLQSPEIAGLVSVDVASLADIQGLLDRDTTLVEYYVTKNRTLAFVITQNTFDTVAVEVSRDDLAKTISAFRDFASLDDPYPASLKQLYTWLISPLKDKLKTPLIGIIPHGVLHYLPFAALTDGERYLSEEYSLFTLPSASVLRFIQKKRKPEANTVLALGEPALNDSGLPVLRFAEQEVQTIASLYGTQPLVGEAGTESAVRAQAGVAGILHLAAHGEYNPANPLFSAIRLAGDAQNDGRLEVHEVYGLDLTKATDLVVLSACQTDVGAVSAGDEVVGLNRAFLYAGAPTVIASLWNVDDEATALLMERFYTHLRSGVSKSEALRQAQREVREKYPHPYYWAAFVLTGDPGKWIAPKAETLITPAPAALATPKAENEGVFKIAIPSILGLAILTGLILLIIRRRRITQREGSQHKL